ESPGRLLPGAFLTRDPHTRHDRVLVDVQSGAPLDNNLHGPSSRRSIPNGAVRRSLPKGSLTFVLAATVLRARGSRVTLSRGFWHSSLNRRHRTAPAIQYSRAACGPPAMNAVAKWRAGFRVSLVRTPALPRSRREEVGSLARVYARFAPNLGRGVGHQGWAFCRERQHRLKSGGLAVSDAESPPDFPARRGPEPSGRSEMDQLGPKTGRVQPRRPPFVEFRDSLLTQLPCGPPAGPALRLSLYLGCAN